MPHWLRRALHATFRNIEGFNTPLLVIPAAPYISYTRVMSPGYLSRGALSLPPGRNRLSPLFDPALIRRYSFIYKLYNTLVPGLYTLPNKNLAKDEAL